MKIWVDDVRKAPDGFVWCKSVNEAKEKIASKEKAFHSACDSARYHFAKGDGSAAEEYLEEAKLHKIELIDLDHDAGYYAWDGGDYIRLLDWLEETGRSYPIRIHSMNPVGVQNMRAIIERNGWTEVFSDVAVELVNEDRIKSMNTEQLAKFLFRVNHSSRKALNEKEVLDYLLRVESTEPEIAGKCRR